MDENHIVFDISSDDEAAFDEPEGDDFSWLSKLLCDEVENSDEVVVVGEIKSKFSKVAVKDEDDDDCVVLEGDPEKDISANSDQAEGDDLILVGHKGQVACRDYPHSRHLCAKFPFGSTAYELHCDLCHCYVCEVVSPCARWGTGASSTDHCRATEKVEFWRNQRKDLRIQKDPDNSLSDTAFSQLSQTPSSDTTQLAPNSLPQIKVSRPPITPPSNNRLSIPNIRSQGRIQQSRTVYSRNRFPTPSVSQRSSLLRPRNTVIGRDRTPIANNLGMFRRSRIAGGVLPMSQPMYGLANNTGHVLASQCANNSAPRATSNDENNVQWVPGMNQDSCTYQSFSQTGTGSVFVNAVPSQSQVYSHQIPQPQVYSQPLPQPPACQPIPQPQVYSQPTPELQACIQPLPQSHIYTNRISQSSDGQNINEFGIQRQNSTGVELLDLDVLVNVSGSNQQPMSDCQLYRTGSINELLSAEDFNSHCNGNAKPHYGDPEYDPWYPENHSVHVTDGYVPETFEAGWAYTLSEDLF